MRYGLILAAALGFFIALFPSQGFSSREVVTLNDGNLLLFVSNNGTFAFDPDLTRDEYSGLYYPKDSYKWVMSGGGIWVSGKKDSCWRVTISGAESEFAPGPASHREGLVDPFPVYRITRGENYALSDDYLNWPAALGASVNVFGEPLISGGQSLFTIFADTDSTRHNFSISGTPPLGVEVKLYAYTYDNIYQNVDTTLSQVVFLDYTITNVSDEAIDSCIVTIYGDPDLGNSIDDRVGSDSLLSAVYCYNQSDYDSDYGRNVPVVGLFLVDRPANSANFYHSYFRSDPPAVKLDSLYKTVNLVKGHTLMGEQYVDPTTNAPTTFPYGGNPIDSSGWVNSLSKDYRFVVNTAPIRLLPHDSLQVKAALVVAQGTTVKESIRRFREIAQLARSLYAADTTKPIVSMSPPGVVEITGGQPRGRDWGGRFMSGGLDLASRYFGYGLESTDSPTVEIRFDRDHLRQAYRFRRVGTGYRFANLASCFVTAVNAETGAPYQIAFIDKDGDGGITDVSGNLDPIIVLAISDSDKPNAAVMTADLSAPSDYKLLALELEAIPADLQGNSITVNCRAMGLPFTQIADAIAIAQPDRDAYSETSLLFRNTTLFMQEIIVATSDPARLAVTPAQFELGTGESRNVFVHRFASDSTGNVESLTVNSYSFRNACKTISVTTTPAPILVLGDINHNEVLDLEDLLRMIRMLYREASPQIPTRQLDGNCDGVFNLSDLLVFVNALFRRVEPTCGSGGGR
jgi:hypothetical protein